MASNNYYTYATQQAAYGSPAAAAAAAAAASYTTNQQGYTSANAPTVAYDAAYQTNAGNAYYQTNPASTTNAAAYSIDYDQSKNAAAAYVTNYANTAVAAAAAAASQGTQNQYAATAAPYPIATNFPSAGYAPVQPQNPGPVSTQGYDAALYSAATMYMAQQTTAARAAVIPQPSHTNNSKMIQKQPWNRLKKNKVGFKPNTQQLHYCEVCKISCAGAQTYKEHLEGSKHKKKEAASKLTGTAATTQQGRGSGNVIKCVLCAVSCTGSDAYAAHIRGSKHQRVLLLHNKLGKPIPEMEVVSTTAKTSNGATKKIYSGTAKMNFVASGELSSAGGVKAEDGSANDCTVAEQIEDVVEKDCQPIGQEYVDEIRGEDGKLVTFHCKLCDCRFNDPNAKEMHMKGRKHRVQFKLKVDPNLHVEIKPYMQQKLFGKDFKFGKSGWKKGAEMMQNNWFGANTFGAPNAGFPMQGPNFNQNMLPQMPGNYYMGRRVDSYDDRHVQTKHGSILPKEEEVKLMRSVIETVETSLTEIRERLKMKDDKGVEVRVIKGVMRVGHYQKGTMLTGERTIQLVITCECKPTQATLRDITAQFANSLKGDYSVRADPDHAAVSIMFKDVRVMVSITSPAMREEGASNISSDVLPIGKCLQALAALRHANWFQKKVTGLRHCQSLIRVMRAHCQKNAVWAPLDAWPLELFVQKIIESSSGVTFGLGDLFRRLMEAVAGGCLLHGSPGLADLCEKDNPDALEYLTDQQREDITNSAQTALRLIAFRQIHKVLGIDKIIRKKKVERKRPLEDKTVDESANVVVKREKMDD